jgi:hypothetical protein
MFPDHCKEVSVKEVSFPLTEEAIKENFIGKKAYKRTRYIVLDNGEDWAVVEVEKKLDDDLFGTITNVRILSLPDTTKYLEDSKLNVLSPSAMARAAEKMVCETLVVKGKFEHVSFIHKESPQALIVYEVVPPEPPKLIELVESALDSSNINHAISVIPKIMNLAKVAKTSENPNIVFPCKASGLDSEKNTFFLDQIPHLSEDDIENTTLIGCDLSQRIFRSLYHKEPDFINFCPKFWVEKEKPKGYVLAKCCGIKEGHERHGDVILVPWGATMKEVENALNDLLLSLKQ